ncbi:MAG: hypothetical protein IKR63_09015 [Alloprevotella sp.]|nr:hypothetical protein [Alloprevotella sp.]
MIDIKDKKDCCGCEACVQRCVGDAFRQAEQQLKAGREVLFSGTPC